MKNGKGLLRKLFQARVGALPMILSLFLGTAAASSYFYMTPAQVDWTSLNNVNYANIDACFRGDVACNATTDGRWRSYPQRTNGDLSGTPYNGCYQYRGRDLVRYANLDSAGNCPCPGGTLTCAGESLVRVFLGYQTFCPGGAPNCTAGGEVRVNCLIETFSVGTGATQIGSYIQNCSDTRPIRLSRSIAVVQASATPGCPAGSSLVGGTCTPCAAGTFKENVGDFACSTCPAAAISNGMGINYSTSPTTGATTPAACRVSYSCATGYTVGTSPASYSTMNGYVGAECTPNPVPSPSPSVMPCNLNMTATVLVPPTTPTSSDGSFRIDITGTPGKASELRMLRNGANYTGYYPYVFSTSPGGVTVTNASAGYYQWVLDATDNSCSESGTNTLTLSAPCDKDMDSANSTRYLSCTYSCGANMTIYTGKCDDSAPLNKVRTQLAGCGTATPTACTFVTPQNNSCNAVTCPVGKYPHKVWDVSALAKFQSLESGAPGGTCGMPGGETPYYVCANSSSPPHMNYPADFGACTSVNGWTYSGTKAYTTPPWNGNGYCTW